MDVPRVAVLCCCSSCFCWPSAHRAASTVRGNSFDTAVSSVEGFYSPETCGRLRILSHRQCRRKPLIHKRIIYVTPMAWNLRTTVLRGPPHECGLLRGAELLPGLGASIMQSSESTNAEQSHVGQVSAWGTRRARSSGRHVARSAPSAAWRSRCGVRADDLGEPPGQCCSMSRRFGGRRLGCKWKSTTGQCVQRAIARVLVCHFWV